MTNDIRADLDAAISRELALSYGNPIRRTSCAALAHLASRAPVDAGPGVSVADPLPWRVDAYLGLVDADAAIVNSGARASSVDAIAHRVNNWDALRAQLTAALAERDEANRNAGLRSAQLLMVGSELAGDGKLDVADRLDPRHTPTLVIAAELRRERGVALARVAELEAERAAVWDEGCMDGVLECNPYRESES